MSPYYPSQTKEVTKGFNSLLMFSLCGGRRQVPSDLFAINRNETLRFCEITGEEGVPKLLLYRTTHCHLPFRWRTAH